jgi:shikimate kinase
MGSGKTTVANILAKKLDLKVIEMDQLILTKSGNKSIPEIFSLNGEEHFRDLETKTAEEISGLNNVVVSTGGGIVMKDRNLKYLENGVIFFLKTSFKVLEKRLFGNDIRPLFKNKIKAKRLFDLRKNIYKKWADHTVLTDKKSVKQVTDSLIKLL